MAKISAGGLTDIERQGYRDAVMQMFASCRTAAELRCLLAGLFSPDELVMLARRLRVADRLLDGKRHIEIRSELGVGFDVITKVRRWLDYDPTTSERLFERSRRQELREQRQDKLRRSIRGGLGDFRRRYRADAAPLELMDEVRGYMQAKSQRRSRRSSR